MRKKVLLFYNPYAANGVFTKNLDRIIQRFQERELVVLPVRASEKNDFEWMINNIDPSEFREVISAGGDGTLNICVNAMIRAGIDLPIAVFPAGTANDFAYHLELPKTLSGQIDVALGENMSYSDIGCVNGLYFVNVAAMGNLVDASQDVDPNLKKLFGTPAYYLKGMQEALGLHSIPMRFVSAEFTGELDCYVVLVTNGESVGGFREMARGAEINDGMLNVLIVKAMSIVEIPRLGVNLLQGSHLDNKNVIYFKTNRLRIEAPSDTSTDVDGERAGEFPMDFTVIPKRVRFMTRKNNIK